MGKSSIDYLLVGEYNEVYIIKKIPVSELIHVAEVSSEVILCDDPKSNSEN